MYKSDVYVVNGEFKVFVVIIVITKVYNGASNILK